MLASLLLLAAPLRLDALPLALHRDALSARFGKPIRLDPDLGREVVLLQADEADPATIRAKLADVLEARWRETPSEWRLEPDRDLARARQDARQKRRLEMIARAQATLRNATVAQRPFDAGTLFSEIKALAEEDDQRPDVVQLSRREQRLLKVAEGSPSQQFLDRWIAAMPAKDLYAASEGRAVWSSRPTRMQRALPQQGLAAQFAREQASWTALKPVPPKGGFSADPRFHREWNPGTDRLRIVGERGTNYGEVPRLTFTALNAKGETVGFAARELEFLKGWRLPPEKPGEPHPADAQPITLPSEAVAFARQFPYQQEGRPLYAAAGGVLRERLLAPVRHEPLAQVAEPALLALAQARKEPIVARLPDDLYLLATELDKPLTGARLVRLSRGFGLNLVREDGWTVGRSAPSVRVDREAFQKCLRALDRARRPDVEAWAEFAAATGGRDWPSLAYGYGEALLPGGMGLMLYSDWTSLIVYGGIPSGQRALLASGASVRFDALSERAQAEVARRLFESDGFSVQSREPSGDHEPTELLPDGIPPDAPLSLRVLEEPGWLAGAAQPRVGAWRWTGLNDRELGLQLAMDSGRRKRDDMEDRMERRPVTRLLRGRLRTLDLQLDLGPAWLPLRLTDHRFDLLSKPISPQDLTPEEQSRIRPSG